MTEQNDKQNDTKLYPQTDQSLDDLCVKMKYKFQDRELLRRALMHRSYCPTASYERLEFLGDRVLGLVIAQWLLEAYPDAAEGELTKRHVALVNTHVLRDVGRTLELKPHLLFSQFDKVASSKKNHAAVPDSMEALLGALYLDGGLAVVERFIKRFWNELLHIKTPPSESKTTLQEYAQKKGIPLPVYEIVSKTGPAHAPRFVARVMVEGFAPFEGSAASKREAEKRAASALLETVL